MGESFKALLKRWSIAAHDPKHSWHEQATFAHCHDSLRRALEWNPRSEAPQAQGDYLCDTKDRGVLVLQWDGIAWDHEETSLGGWEYWNKQVTKWLPIPEVTNG